MKKILRTMLCLSLAACFILAGCGTKKTTTELDGKRSLTHKITDEPLELTLLYADGEYTKTGIWAEAFDRTNIKVNFNLGKNVSDFEQAISLAVASKDVSDILYHWKYETFVDFGMQGALVPLNDLIDKYAPNYKKFLEENPEVRKYTTAPDGNIYYIPLVNELQTAGGWWIRQDWLDKLNLKAPETVDELYKVMQAFKTQDPNGNGKADETPFFSDTTKPIELANRFTGIFDARTDFRYENGKVTYGPLEPEFLELMKTITKWYQEGLIDEEVFTRNSTREYFLGNDLGGITHDWFTSTGAFNGMYKDTIPGFKFVAVAPPANQNGDKLETSSRVKISTEGWAITSANKHPVETMKYFDFWWSEEGQKLASFGVEGKTFKMVDGKPIFTEEFLNSKDPLPLQLLSTKYRSSMNWGIFNRGDAELQMASEEARQGMELYLDKSKVKKVNTPQLIYNEDEQEIRLKYKAQIETHLAETIQKWLLGNKDIDSSYDSFVDELNSLGVEEYTKIEQAAYERYLAD